MTQAIQLRATDVRFLSWKSSKPIRATRLLVDYRRILGSTTPEIAIEVLETPLSFYPGASFVAFLRPDLPGDDFFLIRPESQETKALLDPEHRLDGTNAPIYHFNDVSEVLLTPTTIGDYARFFFHFVHGTRGWFRIVEHPSELNWHAEAANAQRELVRDLLIPLTERGQTAQGLWRMSGTVLFKGALFKTDIFIASRVVDDVSVPPGGDEQSFSLGQIELANEQLLLTDVNLA